MKKLYSLLGAMLVGASLFAQTNYTCTFSANVPMDSVQVKNTVSGEAKMLYYPDNEITLQKVGKTAVATVGNSTFLQQTANNIVAVNVETISLLNLTLYSANGTVVARYANNVNAGQYTFQVGASAGVYVLVASANEQTASLKLSLQENAQAGIFEVATAEPVAFLKSADDVITFNEGEEFEFTGYYKKQTDVKTSAIIESEEIVFAFERDYEGAIKFAFSVSDDKQVYFSQGNLQYQASTGMWRFAENQYDVIAAYNTLISSTYDGWIDLFGFGTSGWNSEANAYQPYSTSENNDDDYIGGEAINNFSGSYANADWGEFNAISNGGNQAGLWRTLTSSEWEYLISSRVQANSLIGQGKVNNVKGLILLPDDWETPSSIKFTCNPGDYTTNEYSLEDWMKMQSYGAIFLPTAGDRIGTTIYCVGKYGYYWSSTICGEGVYGLLFSSSEASIKGFYRYDGRSVRLVQDVE